MSGSKNSGKRPSNRGYRPPQSGATGRSPHGPKVVPNTPRGTTFRKPPVVPATTSLWTYPSQSYAGKDGRVQGDPSYIGATPSWVIWQVLERSTKPGDKVIDPMCGSGTTLDVCSDLKRAGMGFDLVARRDDIRQADARELPVRSDSVDLGFVDPPYSTHIDYSDHRACIGRLDAGADDRYFEAMYAVLGELTRVVRPGGTLAVYVSDTVTPSGRFVPIGFTLWSMLIEGLGLTPVDIVCVVRKNAKLRDPRRNERAKSRGPLARGFNFLLLAEKPRG